MQLYATILRQITLLSINGIFNILSFNILGFTPRVIWENCVFAMWVQLISYGQNVILDTVCKKHIQTTMMCFGTQNWNIEYNIEI